MDDFERRIIKNRIPSLAQNVKVSEDLLASLKRHSLLHGQQMELVLKERTNQARVNKMVEFLLQASNLDTFDLFCDDLMTDYAWLAKELQADVKAEKGSLELDEDVVREAGMLVHRKFGTSKRFSETDKKEMQDLIAVKIQISKEEWKQELQHVRDEMKIKADTLKERDMQLRDIDKELISYLKDHHHQLTSNAHDMKTTSDILKTSIADDDLMGKMEYRLKFLQDRVHRMLRQRDLLMQDRELCMKFLEIKDDATPLHDVLETKMAELPTKMAKSSDDVKQREHTIDRLRKLMREQELEIQEKDQKLVGLYEEVDMKTDKMIHLQERLRLLELENEPKAGADNDERHDGYSRSNSEGGHKSGRKSARKHKNNHD